jgi:hypothetical protein
MAGRKSVTLLETLDDSSARSFSGSSTEGKRPLGRPRLRWEDNIKLDLQEVVGCGDLIQSAQNRDRWRTLVSTVKILRVP